MAGVLKACRPPINWGVVLKGLMSKSCNVVLALRGSSGFADIAGCASRFGSCKELLGDLMIWVALVLRSKLHSGGCCLSDQVLFGQELARSKWLPRSKLDQAEYSQF